MNHGGVDPLTAGREAVLRHAWREGCDLLTEADSRHGIGPEDLERLATAAWWSSRLDSCISARERAFAAYLDAGDRRAAALVALALAKDYYAKGSAPIGTAWLNRAERLLAAEPECVESGQLARLKCVIAHEGLGDYDQALEHARRALEIAVRFGDRELEALALHDQGRALVAKGQVAEGNALMDEATAAAVSGELNPYNTAVVYCNTITACVDLADYGRAGDWTEAAKRWCERQSISGFPGMCRVYRASIMILRGAWPEAEREARLACDELDDFNLSYAAEAFYELGEVRRRTGDAAGAEEAFRHAHELGRNPQPGLALLQLAEGKVESACAGIRQALDGESRELRRGQLLPAQVEIALALPDPATARAAAEELTTVAERYGSEALQAAALATWSRIAVAGGDAHGAIRDARRALRFWQAVGAPFEAARARTLLAAGYLAQGDRDSAVLELEAAAATFARLGALPDVRRAREQLEALGAAGTTLDLPRGSETRTLMFTDMVRSTSLVEAIGDEAWADLLRWHDETLRTLFVAHEGEEVDQAGDGFFVVFPDATAAVECAVAIQRTLAEHRRAHGFAPRVRIGLHTAHTVRRGTGYRGKGVHEAARIAATAGGGEIVASAATLDGTALRFPVSAPRPAELKGVSQPVELVVVDWRD